MNNKKLSHLPVIFVIALLTLSFILILLIDVWNLFGVRDLVIEYRDFPYFWFHWFLVPVEVLQWPMLGLCILTYAFIAGIAYRNGEKEVLSFWLLLGAGVILMLMEDAGDVRHIIRNDIEEITGESSYGYIGTIFELSYFAVLALIPLYAILRYRRVYWPVKATKGYFLLGFFCYGLAVFSSWAGSAFRSVTEFNDLYTFAGQFIVRPLFHLNEGARELYEQTNMEFAERGNHLVEFWFMDRVYEESLELLGAGALLAAGLSFLFYMNNKKDRL